MTTIKELTKKMATVKAEIKEHGANALKEVFKEFFEANPDCKAVRWTQYTPFFNDGEPCEFGMGEFRLQMKGASESEEEDDDGFVDNYSKNTPEVKAVFNNLRDIERIDNEIYEVAFGDHAEVTATRRGFKVEEYDHE